MLTAQQILQKYQQGVAGGSANYKIGVTGKGTTWQTNAASDAAEAAYAAGVQRAAQAKLRQRKVQQVTGAVWEQQAANVGATNYANSANKAATNYNAQINNIVAGAQAAQTAANAIPRGTITNNLNRSREAAIAVHRYWAGVNGVTPEV